MRSRLIALSSLAWLLAMSAGAQTPPASTTPDQEEAAILAVIDKFMDAVANNDAALMAQVRAPDSVSVTARPGDDGSVVVRRRPYNPKAPIQGSNRERYWDPVVHVRGALAVVWTPYEFWSNGKTSHCGIDVFDLYKEQGAWKISHAMWTVEPTACESMRPADASRLRPSR